MPSSPSSLDTALKQRYAGIYLLKLLDLDSREGGIEIPVALPSELAPIDEIMQDLAVAELVEIDARKNRYRLTKRGIQHLAALIDEAETYIDELDHEDIDDIGAEAARRGYDPFRVRFLWGWYTNEFDDLVNFQERRGAHPVEDLWAFYLTSDAFFDELASDLE